MTDEAIEQTPVAANTARSRRHWPGNPLIRAVLAAHAGGVAALGMLACGAAGVFRCHKGQGQRGQTTAEYALVILGAAAIAMLVLAWATGSGRIGSLLNRVIRSLTDQIP